MNIFKPFCFHLPKKGAGADPKKSAPAPAQISNRLRLQPKNLGFDRFRLRNTALYCILREKVRIVGSIRIQVSKILDPDRSYYFFSFQINKKRLKSQDPDHWRP